MTATTERSPAAAPARVAAAIGGLAGWRRILVAMLAGVAMTAGQAPISIPWGLFLAWPVLVWLTDGTTRPVQAALVGWSAAFGMFFTGLFWIGHAFLVDAAEFAWLLPFAVTLLPAGLGLFWGLAFWLARRFWRQDSIWRAVLLAAAVAAVEYARSHVLTGLPWGLQAYVWIETPIALAASIVGPHGLSLLTILVATLPLVMLASGARLGARLGVALAVLVAIPLTWAWALASRPAAPAYASDAPVLRIVQPNAPQRQKWLAEYVPIFYDRLLTATRAPADPELGAPDLIIWPETAVAFLPAEMPERRAEIAAAAGGVPVVLGALHRQPGADGMMDWSNALMTIDADARIGVRYDKHHLVPFGEYVPLQPVLSRIGIRQLANRGGFTPGPGPVSIALADLPRFVPLICYEAIFPHEVAPEGLRAGWMLQITNDAWFGGFGGPQQHLVQARFRAIEQGMPLVRAANTGISAVIDPHGRMLEHLPLGATGAFDARLPAALAPPPYARSGDWPAVVLIFALLVLGMRRAAIGGRPGRA